MKRFSILQDKKECYVCHTKLNVRTHEVYYGRNRQNSIKDGCCIYLCDKHHNMSDVGIHFNKELDLKVKKIMEQKWIEYYNKTIDDFTRRYMRNYL